MSNESLFPLLCALLLGACGHSPVGSGGGASETVASVAPLGDGVRVSAAGRGEFIVTVEVYNVAYVQGDSIVARNRSLLRSGSPEWLIPSLPDSVFHFFFFDSGGANGAFIPFDKTHESTGQVRKRLSGSGTLHGTVTLSTPEGSGAPLPGCRVVLKGSPFSAVTDTNGRYEISGIPEGTYSLISGKNIKNLPQGGEVTVKIIGDSALRQDLPLTTQ